MKKFSLILNIFLSISVLLLYFLHFSKKEPELKSEKINVPVSERISNSVNFSYVEIDSLLKNYNFHKDLTKKLLAKKAKSEKELNTKIANLQKEMLDFQKNVQSGLISSEALARSEQERLMRKEQDLMKFKEELHYKLLEEEQKMTLELNDTIFNFLQEFNKKEKYQFILSKTFGGNLLIANDSLNVTKYVLEGLNEKYKNKK